jgi:hypothetical protein
VTDAEFDGIIARASDPRLIPGIYNYCDRRCGRCPFTDRCLQFREEIGAQQRSGQPREAVFDAVADSVQRAFEMIQIIAERQGIDLSEVRIDEDAYDRAHRATENDPLVVLARQYSTTTMSFMQALRPIVDARGDVRSIDAADTIDWFSGTISAKVFRAISGANDPDFNPHDLQSDANGSAKVARLFIAESRRAWRALIGVGRTATAGVPAKLIGVLDQLDAELAGRFPRALDFVRPGFDEELVPVRLKRG